MHLLFGTCFCCKALNNSDGRLGQKLEQHNQVPQPMRAKKQKLELGKKENQAIFARKQEETMG